MRKRVGAALLTAAMAASPIGAACWNTQEASAARVRDLQSMLMVTTLRCQASGVDLTADYNRFVNANRKTIVGVNTTIKRHFITASGAVQGQKQYDRFTTRLANSYGAPGVDAWDCATAGVIARDAALMAGNMGGLLLVAERASVLTDVPDGMCAPVVMASATRVGGGSTAMRVTGVAPAMAALPVSQTGFGPRD